MTTMMTADQILNIPISQPERMFPEDPDAAKRVYRDYVKEWSTDTNKDPKATMVTTHINVLYAAVEQKISDHAWTKPGTKVLFGEGPGGGKKMSVGCATIERDTDVGVMYYDRETITFEIDAAHRDFVDDVVDKMKFEFAGDAMEEEMRKYLPHAAGYFPLKDRRRVLVLKKTPDVYCLADVLAACGGKIAPKHVAWILNSLYNIACYLAWARISHNAITLNNLFVSPEMHSVMIYGGWWFSQKFGSPLRIVPAEAMPWAEADTAGPELDLHMIRRIGRILLGDESGTNLKFDEHVAPRPLGAFLTHPEVKTAVDDYKGWVDALKAAYGPRKFVKLDIDPAAMYPLGV